MRRLSRFLSFVVMLALPMSCQVQDVDKSEFDNSANVRAYIRSLGCPDLLIQDAGDSFIADGDVVFPKSMVVPRSSLQGATDEQAYTNSSALIYNYSTQKNIIVDVSAIVNSVGIVPVSGFLPVSTTDVNNYIQAIVGGASIWNGSLSQPNTPAQYQSTIRFTVTKKATQGPNVVFATLEKFGSTVGFALTPLPVNGLLVQKLPINLFGGLLKLKYNEQAAVIAHELGHAVGLRHTNWKKINEKTALTIPNTPQDDAQSIMHSGYTSGVSPDDVDSYDMLALARLYPVCPISLSIVKPTTTANNVVAKWIGPLYPVKYFTVWYQVFRNNKQVTATPDAGVNVTLPVNANGQYSYSIPTPGSGTLKVSCKVRMVDRYGNLSPWSAVNTTSF